MKNQELKGNLGSISIIKSKETNFSFFLQPINKRPKLKPQLERIINSFKIFESQKIIGVLEIEKITTNSNSISIITEPIINCLSNIHYKFKIYEIFKMFQNFNLLLKYCNEKGINLSELKLSDIYLTEKNEIKLLSLNYNSEIIRDNKNQKFSDNLSIPSELIKNKSNCSKASEIYIIGVILYYLYYNKYPKNNETEFPKYKILSDLISKCLNKNLNKRINYEEYFNHPFFNPEIIFPDSNRETIIPFTLYKPFNEEEVNIQKCEGINFKSNYEGNTYSMDILDDNNNIILKIPKENIGKFYKLKTQKNKNLYIFLGSKMYVLKKNLENSFSITQEIICKENNKGEKYIKLLELSTGQLVFITLKYKNIINEKNKYISIFSKISENQFQKSLIINEINDPINIYETQNNLLVISSLEESIFYDIKNEMKKIKKEKNNNNNSFQYINNKLSFKITSNSKFEFDSTFSIYNKEYNEEILNIEEKILCVLKLKDGTYLLGGYNNNIYQIFIDKIGIPELICKVDSKYGIFTDQLEPGDCIYSLLPSRPYSVGKIFQFENGDIITYSQWNKIPKLWKLEN